MSRRVLAEQVLPQSKPRVTAHCGRLESRLAMMAGGGRKPFGLGSSDSSALAVRIAPCMQRHTGATLNLGLGHIRLVMDTGRLCARNRTSARAKAMYQAGKKGLPNRGPFHRIYLPVSSGERGPVSSSCSPFSHPIHPIRRSMGIRKTRQPILPVRPSICISDSSGGGSCPATLANFASTLSQLSSSTRDIIQVPLRRRPPSHFHSAFFSLTGINRILFVCTSRHNGRSHMTALAAGRRQVLAA